MALSSNSKAHEQGRCCMAIERTTCDCPFCREEIRIDAIKCKHCGSSVAPEKPTHRGICPYCKEQIHPEAIKCRHCQSNLRAADGSEGDSGMQLPPTPASATPYTRSSVVNAIDEHRGGVVERDAMRGLGDAVARFTTFFGVKPCAGCKQRQERLNTLVPFSRSP